MATHRPKLMFNDNFPGGGGVADLKLKKIIVPRDEKMLTSLDIVFLSLILKSFLALI